MCTRNLSCPITDLRLQRPNFFKAHGVRRGARSRQKRAKPMKRANAFQTRWAKYNNL